MGMRLFFAALEPGRLSNPPQAGDIDALFLLEPPPDLATLRMDKEWHGIHYLLNGDSYDVADEYGSVIFGGAEIGPDLGYGPARVLDCVQVAEISKKLTSLPIEKLRSRYDATAMSKAGVYPDVWEREGTDALEWLIIGYGKVREFYRLAASESKSVIVAIL